MTSSAHRFLIDAAKLWAANNKKVGPILTCMEELGVGRGRSLP